MILFFLAYIIGSIPFAFIFTKLFTRENILEVGWKKTSASNVVKNIGKAPGVLTFVCDVLKGFLVVMLFEGAVSQALAGCLAVLGHNYSIFLKFRGGRGIATLFGAILALNFKLGLILLIPVILSAIMWTASIGTIISYILGIVIACVWFDQGVLLLFLFCFVPVFLKRLSPLQTLKKENAIKRLVFDQDSVPKYRIKGKPL
jgi:glycerol-3-phosphate acyltransferase PlsY